MIKLLCIFGFAIGLMAFSYPTESAPPPKDYDTERALESTAVLFERVGKLEAEVEKLKAERSASITKPEVKPAGPPTPAPQQTATVITTPVAKPFSVDTRPGHWTYPGDLSSHLQTTHGVSTAGLSHQQQLNMHDALHEKSVVVQRPTANCPTGVCPTATTPSRTFYYQRTWRR